MTLIPMRYSDHMDDMFDELTDLTLLQRHILKQRYRFLMTDYRYRCRLYSALFHIFRLTTTVGSLAVPALLSIQNTTGSSSVMYWFTWAVSLAVTASHGITSLFKLDKRFYTLHATAERLRSETWQYVQLSGRYSGHNGHHTPTHANQYVYYCTQLEKINMKRIDDEYIKAGDNPHPPAPGPVHPAGYSMVPSPPDLEPGQAKSRRKDSISTVGVNEEDNTKEAITLQMSGSTPITVSSENPARVPLLQPP